MHLNIFFYYVFILIYLIYNLLIIFHTNNYLATVQDKEWIYVILLCISGLLNIILLVIVGVRHCKEKQKRKIQGEYAWFDVYYITTHWYNNCYAFTQQVFIFWLHIFALVHRTPNGSFEVLL